MKRKFENISLVFFVVQLIITIIGMFLIQKHLTSIARENNIDIIHTEIQTLGSEIMWVRALVVSFSVFTIVLILKSSKDFRDLAESIKLGLASNEPVDYINIDSKNSATTFNINDSQKFNRVKIEIEKLNSEKLSLREYGNKVLSIISSEYEVFQSLLYKLEQENGQEQLVIVGSYAFNKSEDEKIKLGEGLAGQVAKAKRTVNIKQIPSGYIKAISGLGESSPTNLLICPLISNDQTIAVLEIATFIEFTKEEENYFNSLGSVLNAQLTKLI